MLPRLSSRLRAPRLMISPRFDGHALPVGTPYPPLLTRRSPAPPLSLPPPSPDEGMPIVLNWALQLSYDAALFALGGRNALLYCLLSTFFAGSIHPTAGHFLAEVGPMTCLLDHPKPRSVLSPRVRVARRRDAVWVSRRGARTKMVMVGVARQDMRRSRRRRGEGVRARGGGARTSRGSAALDLLRRNDES